jgi:hypothetical protein
MIAREPTRSEYVRQERRRLLTVGIFFPFVTGDVAFCLVVPILWLLNHVTPYLPWIPKEHSIEPTIKTAWLCARFATAVMLAIWAFLFVFVPKISQRPTGKA